MLQHMLPAFLILIAFFTGCSQTHNKSILPAAIAENIDDYSSDIEALAALTLVAEAGREPLITSEMSEGDVASAVEYKKETLLTTIEKNSDGKITLEQRNKAFDAAGIVFKKASIGDHPLTHTEIHVIKHMIVDKIRESRKQNRTMSHEHKLDLICDQLENSVIDNPLVDRVRILCMNINTPDEPISLSRDGICAQVLEQMSDEDGEQPSHIAKSIAEKCVNSTLGGLTDSSDEKKSTQQASAAAKMQLAPFVNDAAPKKDSKKVDAIDQPFNREPLENNNATPEEKRLVP